MVLAARDLFELDGYRATKIAAIASRAGVSAESIYKSFGTKAALAKAVFDLALAGDDEPVPVAERPAMQMLREEPDVRRKIAMFAAGLVHRLARSARVQILIRDGRHTDGSLAPVWDKLNDEGLTGMTMLGRQLLETGQLRPDRGQRIVDVTAVANQDLHPRGARLPLRQALGEHRDLTPHVGLVPRRLHRRAFGDRNRRIVTGERDVEHGLGQRGLGAEALIDAFRRDTGVRGDRGDGRRPIPVPLEQVTSRQHHREAPGAGLLATT